MKVKIIRLPNINYYHKAFEIGNIYEVDVEKSIKEYPGFPKQVNVKCQADINSGTLPMFNNMNGKPYQ
jgi:hypothetical protein